MIIFATKPVCPKFGTQTEFIDMFSFFKKKEPEKLFYSTDMHCHIVPGIDDGAPTPQAGADLVEAQQRWGISRIIATPHVTADTFENTPETIAPALAALKEELTARGIDMPIIHSAEYRIDDYTMDEFNRGVVMPMPDDYLLVENPFIQEPVNLDRTIFDLKVKGHNLVLAHPERYCYYHLNLPRYSQLRNAGLKFQVNLLSLAGHYGKEQKRVAEWMIENKMVDFLGSDLHRPQHVVAIDRYLQSRDYKRHRVALESRLLNDRLDF